MEKTNTPQTPYTSQRIVLLESLLMPHVINKHTINHRTIAGFFVYTLQPPGNLILKSLGQEMFCLDADLGVCPTELITPTKHAQAMQHLRASAAWLSKCILKHYQKLGVLR